MATVTTSLSLADHGRAMTLDDYLDAEVDDSYRYELARGVLEVTNVPDDPHAVMISYFYDEIAAYRRTRPRFIHHYGGGGEFQFLMPGMISGRHPDVAVALWSTAKDPRGRRPASFAVEIVSDGESARYRDYVTKRAEYLAYGLREYWIVDPEERRVTILLRDGDVWVERVVTGDGRAESATLPGFVVVLADLFGPSDEGNDRPNTPQTS